MARLSVEQRRELAIDATMRVIARDGVEAATTRRIAQEAKVGQSSLFYAFTSRDELLAAVVEHGIAQELSAMDSWLSQASAMFTASQMSIADVLAAAFQAFADDLFEHRDREHALVELALYAQRTDGLEHLGEKLYRGYHDMITGLLSAAADAAGITWTRPIAEIVPIVLAMTDGMTLNYLSTGDRATVQHIAEGAARLLLGYAVVAE
ncbi:TetR/AcrR family transcriptional regulator [Gordonia hydrophobica]|uniref:TetR family transcriptional regulator n=1 Tax=Gordonia hydrophobica TaxID=40516 RepID=A0ABZ2U3H7_9ACTN|nr:TetR family transcriptional regulator [Gordonia hydrophobica]MBM7367833.1 AcrR family transcriptional regulator [Gordonia hydrophobica]